MSTFRQNATMTALPSFTLLILLRHSHTFHIPSMSTPAELKVRKLAKLPSNQTCANCGRHQKHGFSTVCIKFHTFVCNDCKSSHQAISHRCKSLTMSSWSDEEVEELRQKGNAYCLKTYLKHAPPCGQQGRPQPGSDLSVYKSFVVDVYERRKYYGEDDGTTTLAATQAAMAPPPRRQIAKAPTSAPLPVADLLDFSSSAPTSTFTVAVDTQPPSFVADFGDFQTAAPVSTATPAALAPPPPPPPPPPLSAPKLAPPPSSAPSLTGLVAMNNTATTFTTTTPTTSMNPQSYAVMNSGGANVISTMGMNGMSNGMSPMMSQSGMANAFPSGGGMPMNAFHQNGGGMNMNAFQQNGHVNAFQSNNSGMAMNTAFQNNNGMNGGMNVFANGNMGMPQQQQTPFMHQQQHQQPMMYHAQGMQATMSMNSSNLSMNGSGMQQQGNNGNKDDPFAGLGGF